MAIRRLTSAGLTAGGKSSKVWDQETSIGYMDAIATAVVDSSGAASITFSNIPQNYTHLQVRGLVLGTSATATGGLFCQVNGDTSANYTSHMLGGNGSTVSTYAATGRTSIDMYGYYDNIISTGSFPIAFMMDVLDYKNTGKYKTFRVYSGMDKNGANYGEIFLKSSVWLKAGSGVTSDAITSLSIFINGSQNLGQYSHIALYGLRG